jgi:hypothetical protein
MALVRAHPVHGPSGDRRVRRARQWHELRLAVRHGTVALCIATGACRGLSAPKIVADAATCTLKHPGFALVCLTYGSNAASRSEACRSAWAATHCSVQAIAEV